VSKLPAFQFYPGDWRKDPGVQSLSFHDRGVWFEIICLMHESERRGVLTLNGNAMPEEALARLLGLDNQILTTTLTTLLTFGVASREVGTGALMSRRMVRDEQIRKIRKECGSKGGNPNLVNQTPTTQVNQIPTPSSSSSSSSSEEKVGRKNFAPPSILEVSEYCKERKNQVSPNKWHDYYTARGWMVGKSKMKDWKAAVRTWENNDFAAGPGGTRSGQSDNSHIARELEGCL
jgi:hypothetical protein